MERVHRKSVAHIVSRVRAFDESTTSRDVSGGLLSPCILNAT
jgi:hypothetical protein